MTEREFAFRLGKLVSNFLALEHLLRLFLYELQNAQPLDIQKFNDIYTSPIGTKLHENELTNFHQLKKLIKDFNVEIANRHLPLIDPTLVEIRDALAHGRILVSSKDKNTRLIKFDNPINEKVNVVFNEILSKKWFKQQTIRTNKVCQFIAKCSLPR